MSRIVTLVAGLVMFIAGSSRTEAGDLAWGVSTNGLSIGISQSADGKDLDVRFRNDTDVNLYVVTDFLWYHCDLLVDGKRVTRQHDCDDIFVPVLTPDSFVRLEPGKVAEQRLPLNYWAPIPESALRLRYRNTAMMRQKNDGKEFGLKAWIGIADSNSIKIKTANRLPLN